MLVVSVRVSAVVLITTKKGSEGMSEIGVKASYGFSKLSNSIEMLGAEDYMRAYMRDMMMSGRWQNTDFYQEYRDQIWKTAPSRFNFYPDFCLQTGTRSDKDFPVLWNMLKNFDIDKYYTDDWGSYSKYIPPAKHRTGKDNTWKIERKNLNFRTYLKRLNRKTICFSKNETVHDNVIGMYIETFYYKTGTYGNNIFN
jgi:IS1 family transposase